MGRSSPGGGGARPLTVIPAYIGRFVEGSMIRSRTRGRRVFLASVAIREPIPNIALSNACRIGVAGLVRALAHELGHRRSRVNGILPGRIVTGPVNELFEHSAQQEHTRIDEAGSGRDRGARPSQPIPG